MIGLLGVTVGLASGGFGVLIAVLAVLLQVMFCITLARFVTTALAGMLRSRRGRDFAVLLILPIFALYEGFIQIVPRLASSGKLTAASFAGVDTWLRWIPPGLAAHAIGDASDGHPGTALARLGLLAGVIVVLGWLWVRALGRALVTTDTTTQSAAVHGTALPFGRFGLRGTVAARFWIYQRRDPLSLIYWGIIAIIMVAASISTIIGPNAPSRRSFLSAVLGAGVHRLLPRQCGRADRAVLRHRGHGADRPQGAARLLLRPEHRARRDRGAAAHRALFGLGAVAGFPTFGFGHARRPGGHRRRAGPEQRFHGHLRLPDGKAGWHPDLRLRTGLRVQPAGPASPPCSGSRYRSPR